MEEEAKALTREVPSGLNACLQRKRKRGDGGGASLSPFLRMQSCRDALSKLDTLGWARSYHQRLFHEDFLVCMAV